MVADRIFLYISEVGPVCDEIRVYIGRARVPAAPHGPHIIGDEFLEGPCTETALQPGAVLGKYMIRFCIARETED